MTAYDRYLELVQIYNTMDASQPRLLTRLARWYELVRMMKSFKTVLETIMNNNDTMQNNRVLRIAYYSP